MADYEKIATLDNEFEAQLLASILEEREIPHRLRSYHDTAFDGLFQTQKGWGVVQAPDAYADEVREIIADIRKGYEGSEE